MATVRKRISEKTGQVSWQIDYFDPTGKRIRQSFKKKKDAEAELGKRVSLIAENRYLDKKKDFKTTLGKLTGKYQESFGKQPSYVTSKYYIIRNFKDRFGEKTLLANFRYVDFETYRNQLRGTLTKVGNIRTNASVNREMSCLHHLFGSAVRWDMMEVSPFTKGPSLGSWLAMRNVSIKTIQELMGHKDISMTMRYAHLAENVKREAVNMLNGLTGKNPDCHATVTQGQMGNPTKIEQAEITSNI